MLSRHYVVCTIPSANANAPNAERSSIGWQAARRLNMNIQASGERERRERQSPFLSYEQTNKHTREKHRLEQVAHHLKYLCSNCAHFSCPFLFLPSSLFWNCAAYRSVLVYSSSSITSPCSLPLQFVYDSFVRWMAFARISKDFPPCKITLGDGIGIRLLCLLKLNANLSPSPFSIRSCYVSVGCAWAPREAADGQKI